MSDPLNKGWLRKWLRFEPHFIIGGEDDPYLLRWYVIPRNRFVNLYLHKFLRSDDDRALHDHPWSFLSILLKGSYIEHTPDGVNIRRSGSIAYRRPRATHRVQLWQGKGGEVPCWTLIFTGPKIRKWGFVCSDGWVHWEKFVESGCE